MTITNMTHWLWFETWWAWKRPANLAPSFQDLACHYFNLFEASVWFVFAGLVVYRWFRFRQSSLEIVYAIAFLVFGVSDVIEAWRLTSWLLWWKVANLILLFRLRQLVMRRYYPNHRLY